MASYLQETADCVRSKAVTIPAGKTARFVRNFMDEQSSIKAAFRAYIKAVKDNTFPAQEHCF
jgi:ketopantoate hydroxymethyltransferase